MWNIPLFQLETFHHFPLNISVLSPFYIPLQIILHILAVLFSSAFLRHQSLLHSCFSPSSPSLNSTDSIHFYARSWSLSLCLFFISFSTSRYSILYVISTAPIFF